MDDTLLLIKPDEAEMIKTEYGKFDRNLKFTFDKFENQNPHFLDMEITSNGLKIYRKDTFTGHYTDFSSFVPWNYRVSWIRSLIYRAKRICDKRLFKEAIRDIKTFASWNGFPRNVRNGLVHKFIKAAKNNTPNSKENEDENTTPI